MTDHENKFAAYFKQALETFATTGDSDQVLTFATSLQGNDGDYRDSVLSEFAKLLAARAELDDAMRYCLAIPDLLERSDAMFGVAAQLVTCKNPDGAKRFLFAAIESGEAAESSESATVLLQISGLLQHLGEMKDALNILNRAAMLASKKPQSFEAGETLRGCARLLASWDRLSEAVGVANTIESPGLKQTALEEIHGRGKWPVYPGVPIE